MGILSDASWIVGEYLLGLHNFILRLLFLDLLPTFMIRNRETTLGSIRKKIQVIRRNVRKEYGGKSKTECL